MEAVIPGLVFAAVVMFLVAQKNRLAGRGWWQNAPRRRRWGFGFRVGPTYWWRR